ncbi:Lrp/AsnC family transcriptional regulator [Rosenbergiella epipactidis]|uniref:Lrp/AsnC family transcriptional regulator n=1 Tax=Rosenbergiella epipactidis TaxID=1544694 RepID=UPI001BDA7232|nr:Lrp/AsnC family transcriptional regulator [Rosenbergiella epipactidis]MBT0716806.1 Lrp/AsnC family transcriptional regulator [Rosenbergiella epipactidis]
MDNFDWRIISALQLDGRLTNQEVGEKVGLSASQCSRRRTALEEAGIIQGYSARVNGQAIGLQVLAYVHINLPSHDPKSMRHFQHIIDGEAAIQEVHMVSGEADYLLKIIAANLEQLADFISHTLLASEVISHVKSFVVLKKLKQISQLPTRPV